MRPPDWHSCPPCQLLGIRPDGEDKSKVEALNDSKLSQRDPQEQLNYQSLIQSGFSPEVVDVILVLAPPIGPVRALFHISTTGSHRELPIFEMSAPATVNLQTYEGFGITLLVLASGFVALRCFVSFHGSQHRLGIDDCA